MTLLAAYSFDEGGLTVVDYSGNGNNFTLTASGTRVAGHTNGGLQATGAPALQLPAVGVTTERTVMLWIHDTMPDQWLIKWWVASITSGAWGILYNQGNIGVQARSSTDVVQVLVPWPTDGAWHHAAATYDGTTVSFYLDGILADSAPLTGPLRTDTDPPVILGWDVGSGDTVIDDLRIYDDCLDATSVATAMAAPVAGNLASAATLAVDAAFVGRVTAAVQRNAVLVGQAVLAAESVSPVDKARLVLAQKALADPTSFGTQFAWAIASDGAVTSAVTDDVIAVKVSAAWNLVAGVPV